MDNKTLFQCELFKTALKHYKITQAKFACISGWKAGTVNQWCRKRRKVPVAAFKLLEYYIKWRES